MSSLNRLKELGDAIRQISEKPKLTQADAAQVEKLAADFEREHLEFSRSQAHSKPLDSDPIGEPRSATKYRKPWELLRHEWGFRTASPKELKERALSAVEHADGANDAGRERMAEVLEEDDKAGTLSKVALLTTDPDYVSAFAEMARTGGANPLLSESEIQAVRRVKTEARAMGLTDSAGGFLIPFQLDPAVIITSDGSFAPIRRVAKAVQALGDTYNPVSSGAVSWSWDAEAEEVSDDATTFAQPSITIHKAQGFVPISMEALEDAANVAEEVGKLLSFGRDTLTSTAFVTGSGTGEPFGIITALNTVAGSIVACATSGTFGAVDVYSLDEDLPARYRQGSGAAFFAHRAIWHDVEQFETTNGSQLFPAAAGNPGRLFGVPTYEAEAMDGTISTADDHILVYGDFANYVIADRSSSVEFIPHLFSTGAGRPTGQRGFFATYRVGE